MKLTHWSKQICNEPISCDNRLEFKSAHSLVPIVNNSLHFPWSGNRPHCPLNEAKTIFQGCSFISDGNTIFLKQSTIVYSGIPLSDSVAMQVIDKIHDSVCDHTKFRSRSSKTRDHISVRKTLS